MSFFENQENCCISGCDYDAISLNLIKQKTRGIIADYHFNGECWDVKARNGAVYSGQLDINGNGFGKAIWYCEGQIIQKYYNCPIVLDVESFDIYDEAIEMVKQEEEKMEQEYKSDEIDFLEEDYQNNMVA